ncbi:putative lipoprotein [Plesiocystis pacifica SIR-1]|uniref:Putative lipoprotein n=1 Tax=Plesiocystis pacifica SIR-1 TaxID=391625 RepID=A6G8P8_9BACT|nr:hypothetical protein [Plesiocystis pacifica]EDM77708.1 putative lipoprotein [Plesiocystis pacifica SIR-1]
MALALVSACGGSGAQDDEAGATTTPEGEGEADAQSDDADTDDADDTDTIVPEADEPPEPCDMFAQDCPEGDKCVPEIVGGQLQQAVCTTVVGDTPYGEPCSLVEGGQGYDTCDDASWCFNLIEVEGELVGTCTPFCTGNAEDADCPEGYACQLSAEGPPVCVDICDPLVQDCPGNQACYWTNSHFACVPTTAKLETGQPCGFINDCDEGSMCLSAEVLNGCSEASCCGDYCSLAGGDGPCQAIDPAYVCEPFFEEGMAPEEWADVGVCVLPQS